MYTRRLTNLRKGSYQINAGSLPPIKFEEEGSEHIFKNERQFKLYQKRLEGLRKMGAIKIDFVKDDYKAKSAEESKDASNDGEDTTQANAHTDGGNDGSDPASESNDAANSASNPADENNDNNQGNEENKAKKFSAEDLEGKSDDELKELCRANGVAARGAIETLKGKLLEIEA